MSGPIQRTDTVIHVNRGTIDSNRKRGERRPPLRMQHGRTGKAEYGSEIVILDQDGRPAARIVYDPAGILACGAKCVIIAPHGAQVTQNDPDAMEPAIHEIPEDHVKMPETADEAALMSLLGEQYLRAHAPERLNSEALARES